ncbi:MAG: hypothetical protein JNL95_04645 [Chitinophagales bacterium]|nr:hypothetical protein [Chitinophagales bacterium]
MYILGINGGFRQGYQDVSACLIHNGKVIAAIEEERISRVKFSAGKLPYSAIVEVLKIGNITIQDIGTVAFHGSTWGQDFDKKIETYFKNFFGYSPPIKRYHHHDCHAAGSFFSSGFDEALLITLDNSGDGVSVQIAIGKKNKIEVIKRYDRPQSLGLFYSLITQYCGFTKDSEEYKLMGLAAFGDKTKFDFSWLLPYANGEFQLNTAYIEVPAPLAPSLHRDEMNFNQLFIDKIGKEKRIPGTTITQFYKDVAASAQFHLEATVLHLTQHYIQHTGIRNVCLSGGVSLNCLMNQKIMNASVVDNIFIQPAASDAGISMGAAWLAGLESKLNPVTPNNTFLGNEFSAESIQETLQICQVNFTKPVDIVESAAKDLAEGKVIAWFQGKMEFGPRALGNRSILANPCLPEMQKIVNQKIKFRESFRPFGASVLEQDINLFFQGKAKKAPYMTLVYQVAQNIIQKIPAVVHADETCRIQTVCESDNPLYFGLLSAFKKLTGYGVLLNTSFNLNHEPIVNTPREAIASFYSSGLDMLYLGNFRIEKLSPSA